MLIKRTYVFYKLRLIYKNIKLEFYSFEFIGN